MVVAGLARAETWADEPSLRPSAPLSKPPLFGVTGGVHLMTGYGYVAPAVGSRLGLRVRLGQHAALSAMTLYELHTLDFVERGVQVLQAAHLFYGVLRLEAFSVSAFDRLLVPEFSVGFFAGAGVEVNPTVVLPSFVGGIHLGMTRLRPSGWWFPLFVELGVAFFIYEFQGKTDIAGAVWRLSVGVGL